MRVTPRMPGSDWLSRSTILSAEDALRISSAIWYVLRSRSRCARSLRSRVHRKKLIHNTTARAATMAQGGKNQLRSMRTIEDGSFTRSSNEVLNGGLGQYWKDTPVTRTLSSIFRVGRLLYISREARGTKTRYFPSRLPMVRNDPPEFSPSSLTRPSVLARRPR